MPSMDSYSKAAMERPMKVQDVMLQQGCPCDQAETIRRKPIANSLSRRQLWLRDDRNIYGLLDAGAIRFLLDHGYAVGAVSQIDVIVHEPHSGCTRIVLSPVFDAIYPHLQIADTDRTSSHRGHAERGR